MQKAYPNISIIVPVYNTGKYLSNCIDSIIRQTILDWELILVNDGSTDESESICNRYAKSDSRIKVIHQQNFGVGAARNAGISVAAGKYIGFVDADDTVRPEMFRAMLELAKGNSADIVMCDSVAISEGKPLVAETIEQLDCDKLLEKTDLTPKLLFEMAGAVWRCIYRKTLLKYNCILFPLDVKLYEDRIFNLYAMGKCESLFYTKTILYEHRIHSLSAVHSFHADYFEHVKSAAKQTKIAIDSAWSGSEEYQTVYLQQFVSGALAAINNYHYKTSTLSSTEIRQKVQTICDDTELKIAIEKINPFDVRAKWILNKKIRTLCMCAVFLNAKHRR